MPFTVLQRVNKDIIYNRLCGAPSLECCETNYIFTNNNNSNIVDTNK